MILLFCFPVHVKAEFSNPRLPVREPFCVEDEQGNSSVYLGNEYSSVGQRSASLSHWSNSKKGLQENEYLLDANYKALGVKQVLLNIVLSECITYGNGKYHLNQNSGYMQQYKSLVPKLNSDGVTVSLVLLMNWSSDPNIQRLIYAGGRTPGKDFYELNTQDAEGKQAWINIFRELIQTFSTSGCHVDYYILGNEVNQTGDDGYNYTGSNDLNTNANAYADAFMVLDQAIAEKYPTAKAFISLDHNWNATDTGHSGKSFLDAFASAMAARNPSAGWSVAWHAYAVSLRSNINTSMDNLVIWNSSQMTHDVSTRYISGANIDVLTEYLRNNWGNDHRVILSEQGFDASGSTAWQSAFIAYAFYAAQYNDMVDAVMYRAYLDNPDEGGLKFGLIDGTAAEMYAEADRNAYIEDNKRPAYDVFKYMDTDMAAEYTYDCLNTIGVSSWKELLPAYTGPEYTLNDGWNVSSSGARYYVENNKPLKGWQTIEGKTYYFTEPNGFASTGTPVIDGNKYWFNGNGEKQTGWLYLGDWKLYFDPVTYEAKTGLADIDGKKYLFNSDGVMQTYAGTPVIDGKKYWFSTDEASLKTGWLYLLNWKLYFDSTDYAAKTGFAKINGKMYLFNEDGVMQNYAGTTVINGKKYWFSTDDASLQTGWLDLGQWKLYFDPETYAAVTGTKVIDGETYVFDGNGAMQY